MKLEACGIPVFSEPFLQFLSGSAEPSHLQLILILDDKHLVWRIFGPVLLCWNIVKPTGKLVTALQLLSLISDNNLNISLCPRSPGCVVHHHLVVLCLWSRTSQWNLLVNITSLLIISLRQHTWISIYCPATPTYSTHLLHQTNCPPSSPSKSSKQKEVRKLLKILQ